MYELGGSVVAVPNSQLFSHYVHSYQQVTLRCDTSPTHYCAVTPQPNTHPPYPLYLATDTADTGLTLSPST